MKTKSLLLYVIGMFFISEFSEAQITFQKKYESLGGNTASYSVQQTTDSGYVTVGVRNNIGSVFSDIFSVKTDMNGNIMWSKTFGGLSYDIGWEVQQTTDGGYIIIGYTLSFGASSDAYLIKIDINGDTIWTKTFGGTFYDVGRSVKQTTDGGYVIAGFTQSFGAGGSDVYLVKTDVNGDLIWAKTFGGLGADQGFSVEQTIDGGYIITGVTNSFGAGSNDVYLIKIDTNGDALWTKTFGGTGDDVGWSVQQTTDGGYIITGATNSFGADSSDVYLIKVDTNGILLWTKTFGGADDEGGRSVKQTTDGGYIIAGLTLSFGAGGYDVYLVKTDANGVLLWTKTFGGVSDDYAFSVQQTTDDGYIITGFTNNTLNPYSILIKTDSNGNSVCNQSSPTTIVTLPTTQVTTPATIAASTTTIVTTPATMVSSGSCVVTPICLTGISTISNPNTSISISPNPFHSTTVLKLCDDFSSSDLTLEIFNVEGKTIRKLPVTSRETVIERNDLAPGIYFYKITSKKEDKAFGKLIID